MTDARPGPTAPTVVMPSTVHGIRVAAVTPPHHRRTCVVAMGFGAWLDPFELQRFTRLAQALRVRLLVVESPGLGNPGTSLTRRERGALLTGRYTPVARRMLAAATSVIPKRERVHLLGYSMGASIVTAMAADRSSPPALSLTLIEPVATRVWNPAALVTAVHRENGLIDSYLLENRNIPGSIIPSDRIPHAPQPARKARDQFLLAAGLVRGRIGPDLQQCADSHPHLPVMLVHGRASLLSRPAQVASLARSARERGLTVTDTTVDGGHGLWQSLPRVEDLATHINQFWATT